MIKTKYQGEKWKIYYMSIDDFEADISELGVFLDRIEKRGEEVIAIIPNIGLVKTSLLLGTSFQGVKGFAIVVRHKYLSS